jgi:hypothetical protein
MRLGSFRPIFDIVQGLPQNQEAFILRFCIDVGFVFQSSWARNIACSFNIPFGDYEPSSCLEEGYGGTVLECSWAENLNHLRHPACVCHPANISSVSHEGFVYSGSEDD